MLMTSRCFKCNKKFLYRDDLRLYVLRVIRMILIKNAEFIRITRIPHNPYWGVTPFF